MPKDAKLKYTDIGHSDPHDKLWLIDGYNFYCIDYGKKKRIHEELWGKDDLRSRWWGRYDVNSGLCSIAAPEGFSFTRPLEIVLEILKNHFSITYFVFFTEGYPTKFAPMTVPSVREKGREGAREGGGASEKS